MAALLVALIAFDPSEPSSTAPSSDLAAPPEVVELHASNFDDTIAKHEEVLVHFHAPWSKRCDVLRPHLRAIQQGAEWGGRFVHAESDISDSRGYTSYLEHHGVTRLPALVLFRNGHPTLYPPEEPLGIESVDAWLYQTTQKTALPRGDSDSQTALKMLVRGACCPETAQRANASSDAARSPAHGMRRAPRPRATSRTTSRAASEPPPSCVWRTARAAQDAQAEADERIREMAREASRQEEERRRQLRQQQEQAQGQAQPQQQQRQQQQQPPPPTDAPPQEQPAAADDDSASSASAAAGEAGEARELSEASAPSGSSSTCLSDGLSDASFERVVMEKAKDVFVLFYRPSASFCAHNGTAYAAFAAQLASTSKLVLATSMDVRAHRSPFVFEEGELPVAMLFPADDKRPLEFDQPFSEEALHAFVREHAAALRPKPGDDATKKEL
jgi:hypothetical protein